MMDQPRRHVRLSFSGRPAPRLETDAKSYEVVDLSPDGIRFRSSKGVDVTIGDALRGTLLFPAHRSVEVAGRVLRVSGAEAAVLLDEGMDHLAHPVPMGAALPRRTGLLW
jgi:PilZ domain-containing protein